MVESPGAAVNGKTQNWKWKMPERFFIPHWVSIIFLVLLTYAVYHESLDVPFCWDDDNLILRDQQIRSLTNIPSFFGLDYWKNEAPFRGANFRPLRTASFAVDYFLWEYNPYGYHLTNLFFHIFNVLLVYFFVYLLLQLSAISHQPSVTNSSSLITHHSSLIPLFSAVLFAAHPIHTEAVVWIKNRSEIFSTFFFLSSLLYFIKSQTPRLNQSSKYYSLFTIHYSLSLVCFILALLSKEVAITLPFMLVFYSFFFLLPDNFSLPEKGKKIFLSTLPFWVIGILYTFLRIRLIKLAIWSTEPASTLDLSSRILLVIKTVGEYLKLLLFPVNLSAERLLRIPKSILEPDMLFFSGAIILLLVSGVLLLRRAKPTSLLLGFSLFWVIFTILPTGNIYYLYTRPLAEQRLYLPSVGFCILLALIIAKGAELMQRAQKISLWISRTRLPKLIGVGQIFGVLAVAGILVFYSAGTIRRTADWKEPLRFWEKTLQSNPNYWRAQVNLGLAYLYENRIEEGIQILEQALPLAPEAPKIYFSLGFAYEMQGKIEEATAAFEKGIMNLTSSDIGKAYLNPHIRSIMPKIREI
ncbi:MAG: tetratricopeptide repeat protein, partial [Planctomycetota bacterium]